MFDADGFPRETVAMLRTLLTERFNAEGPYRQPAASCLRADTGGRRRRTGAAAPEVRAEHEAEWKKIIGGGRAESRRDRELSGRMIGNAVAMPSFATVTSSVVDRPVIDRTGLKGVYDYELEGVEISHPGPFGPSCKPSDTKESITDASEATRPEAGQATRHRRRASNT